MKAFRQHVNIYAIKFTIYTACNSYTAGYFNPHDQPVFRARRRDQPFLRGGGGQSMRGDAIARFARLVAGG
jgi:hypothetical protein